MICDMDQRQKRATKNAIWVFPWKKICLESLKANIDFMLIKQFVPILQSCPNFTMIIWLHIFCQIFVKFKIAFFSEQPCMERISAKYSLPSLSWNRYFVKFLLSTFTWSSIYSSDPVLFLIKLLLIFFYNFAGLVVCDQLAPKYV